MAAVQAHRTRAGAPRLRHEALFYDTPTAFMAGVLPRVRAALGAGDPVMVVVGAPRQAALRTALGADAAGVTFADIRETGRNPARLVAVWQGVVQGHEGRPVLGVGEPVWPGRRPAEVAECHCHEGLFNVALAGAALELLCPYDARALPTAVLDAARRTHPLVAEGGAPAVPSAAYAGADALAVTCDDPLDDPP